MMAADWIAIKLPECADILDHLRKPVNEEERSLRFGDTPYYGANGLQGKIAGWIFDEPLVLMAEDGGYFDQFQTRPVAYKISGKSWVNNHAHVIKPKESFDFDFIFYSLEHKDVMPFIKGGTRAKLNQKELRSIEIFLPRKKKAQEKISDILLSIDQTIEKTEALIHKYQEIKAGLMHDLFTRGVTADGKLRPSREQAAELYKETRIGWIPRDWVFCRCSKVCEKIIDCKNRTPPITPEGYPVIRTPNVRNGEFIDEELVFTDSASYQIWTKRGQPKVGDIVITREAPVGEVCMIPARHVGACLGQRMMLYRPDINAIDPRYFLFVLQSQAVQDRLDMISGGSTVGHVRVGDIRDLCIFHPESLDEQKVIGNVLNSITKKVESEKLHSWKLKKQKSGLMHDLLTGRVPVKIDQ